MRIISKFKDVYDLQHSMFDESRVWQRKTESFLVKVTPETRGNLVLRENFGKVDVVVYPLFLAGHIHSIYRVLGLESSYSTVDPNKVVEILEKNANFLGSYFNSEEKISKRVSKLVDKLANKLADQAKILEELRVPIATVSGMEFTEPDASSTQKVDCYNIVVNPQVLDKFPWQEIEPNLYRLHQTLEQYIFGVLGTGEPDLLTTSDKDRLEAHGFSAVTSFRNMSRE